MKTINQKIAEELEVRQKQIDAAVALLDEGATVPFISRYRKEKTGSLDDSQLRKIDERLHYLRELDERRLTILKSIEEQGKLTPELEAAINQSESKTTLEDLYLPYKPKRRTKAQIAREAGLEPLALGIYADPTQVPESVAAEYVNIDKGIADVQSALDGAKQILMEKFSEDANLLSELRQYVSNNGVLRARVGKDKQQHGAKFRDYFEYDEVFKKIPGHRALAIFRGRNEGILKVGLVVGDPEDKISIHPCEMRIAKHWQIRDQQRAADKWLLEVVRFSWQVKISGYVEIELLSRLREHAEQEAIQVFAGNLKDLLLAAPAGQRATIGLDPGLRTGVKVAVLDATGKLLEHCAIYPTPPQNKHKEAEAKLVQLAKKHRTVLIAIGNGTGSRETDRFVGHLIKNHPELKLQKVVVNESGASIYSASELAAKEFPDLDVTIRGAVSIARRLQDPLAELVKIDPKSIGVGQYQHDVNQVMLSNQLVAVVEDCVNAVGVDVNTASAPLLSHVSGLNQAIANNVVSFREQYGALKNRKQLKKVSRLGDKSFEQAAGFLRVSNGDNPLDASAVHPESYAVVTRIAEKDGRDVKSLIGDSLYLKSLNPEEYTSIEFGLPTVTDIIEELNKPGRDPRPEFKTADFKEGVESLKDLEEGMVLEGTVTNVTNFGAFVDIGVHQDGLVHISALADTFVKDPREVIKAGDIVKVRVLEVDIARKRISLSRRLSDEKTAAKVKPSMPRVTGKKPAQKKRGTLADVFAIAQSKQKAK